MSKTHTPSQTDDARQPSSRGARAPAAQVEAKPRPDQDAASPKDLHPSPPFPKQRQQPPGIEAQMDPQPRWRGESYRPANKLEGRVALITGGDSGIGRSVAYFFAREGADVAIVCLPEENEDAESIRDAIEQLGRRCLICYGDLVKKEFCDECVEKTVSMLGRLDILVHNAAWQNRKPDVTQVSEEELDRTMKTNVYAYIRLARKAVPYMPAGSSIIATGSVVGIEGSGKLSDYSATKGAIHALTKTLAQELLDKGIRVNCVAPGPVWTPLNVADTGASPEDVSKFGKETGSSMMERPAQPEELAPAYVYLASNADSSYVTGIILPVTGGPTG